ncbi:hypothetical protein HYALB_00002974 [Hymenoscyphus albidus]|uniref:Uncharacterized protein n=1 Tax=Hymenoscyphus albidus TaxID=595503 RepID=A0A9N9M225_9HELO|nr:hypothetical protein HYALB_00002974 [Hymenoscyphus albidus]
MAPAGWLSCDGENMCWARDIVGLATLSEPPFLIRSSAKSYLHKARSRASTFPFFFIFITTLNFDNNCYQDESEVEKEAR